MKTAPQREQPGRSPQGPAAPVKAPAPVKLPTGPPQPALQAVGFSGSIHDFNDRLDAVARAHAAATGTKPTPGVALDVTRSPVPTEAFGPLFSAVPQSRMQAKAQQVLTQHKQQNPDEYFVTRPDGIIQADNPVRRLIEGVTPAAPIASRQTYVAPPHVATLPELQKKYPMVTMGALPIPNEGALYDALNYLNAKGPTALQNGIDPTAEQAKVQSFDTYKLKGGSLLGDQSAVTTIKQAQAHLNTAMGTSLPVTGYINDTWAKALHNWTNSTDYFRKQLAYQAQDAGFGTNVGQYVKAWKAKQSATEHGLYGHFLAAMPLPLFGHGNFWQDLASTGTYLKGTSNNPLNVGLHSLTRTAGLTLDTVGGTVSQAKADAAAGMALARAVAPVPGFKPQTFDEALHNAREQLRANPSWLRIAAAGELPTKNEPEWLKLVDNATNIVGDLVLLRKPAFTGERIAVGDLAAARQSTYLNTTAGWAFNDLQKFGANGIGRAASRLEGGAGARALVARAAPLVKNGSLTREQFSQHVAELYANGKTTLTLVPATETEAAKAVNVQGALLGSLQTAKLPTPGAAGQWLLERKSGLRDALDTFDATARGANSGLLNRSADLVTTLRSAIAHAAPQGGRLGYFQDILPERVFNFVVKHKLGDDTVALANKLESDLVRFQGKENVRGIQSVEQQIKSLYYEKYGRAGTNPQDDPFNALLETEAPSVFKFPGGNEAKPEAAFDSIGSFTTKLNGGLNKAGKLMARVILSGFNFTSIAAGAALGAAYGGPVGAVIGGVAGGPFVLGGFSLFWKHLVGDGLRAIVGGMGDALKPQVRRAKGELKAMAANDSEFSRRYGALLDRMRTGEANWALNRGGWNILTKSFDTGDHLKSASHMNAAGEFLRRQIDSKALDAWKQGDLVNLILSDKQFRGLWQSARSAAKKTDPSSSLSAEDYAALIDKRYRAISDALQAQGLTLDDASTILRANAGHDAGPALGDWIKQHGLDIPVDHGQVETRGTFDDLTGRWVGNVIMRPNKFWRKNFGETVLAKHYSDLREAGFPERQAFDVASNVAERVTKFHMLDFANRLQMEQDLRWLSYFATKHRLYFKWVLSTFARNPRYAAAVADFHQTLNKSGGISVPLKVLGQSWQIPAERMVWVPGREYDETSPLALGVFNFVKSGGNLDAVTKGAAGTNGNVLTRSDTATVLGTKLLKIELGQGATYQYARAGLDKKTGDKIWRSINEYQTEFYRTHGHYAPESQAVKTVLVDQMGQEYWRANLPLPLVPETDRTPHQQLLADYMSLVAPAARRKFLDKHPGFSDSFGVYQNPQQYLHNREYFQRWTSALDAYHSARRDLYAQAKASGEWTTTLEHKRRDLNASLEQTRQNLLVQDARSAGVDTTGGIPNGTTIPYGPWGKVANKDPQFDPAHFLSVRFPKLAKNQQGDIIGPLQKSLQNELTLLSDPAYVQASVQTPEEIKTLKREILQKLEVFKAYPTDALGAVRDQYQTRFVNKYWATYDAKYKDIGTLPSDKRKAADATFRAWRDSQDQAVVVNGVKFPSPVRMAWATLDPKTRQERLSYLASKSLSDLANYELDLLGVKHPENASTALAALANAGQEYRKQYPGQPLSKDQLIAAAKQIDKQPGYKGFAAYYTTTLALPRIRQFESTNIYVDMPSAARQKFDSVIGNAAKQIAADAKASKQSSYYGAQWRKAIETQITPWLNAPEQKVLRDYLAPMGPNFLNELIAGG